MISSPEAARIVLVTQAHLFKPTYPPSKEKMIGPEALFFHQGAYHSRLKKLVQASFLPSAIRGSVSEIEQIVLKILPTWENTTINTLQEMKRVCRFVVTIFIFFCMTSLCTSSGILKKVFVFILACLVCFWCGNDFCLGPQTKRGNERNQATLSMPSEGLQFYAFRSSRNSFP